MDFVYIGTVVGFFLVSWGLLKVCELLSEHKSGEKL